MGIGECNCGSPDHIPAPQSWATELEKLALTEPDPNKAVYNLPQLKAFIAEQISKARPEGVEDFIKRLAAAKETDDVLPEIQEYMARILKQ